MFTAIRINLFISLLVVMPIIGNSATPTDSADSAAQSWNPRDVDKGFLSEDEEGNYYYKKSDEDDSVEVNTEEKYEAGEAAKASGLTSVLKDGSHLYKVEESEKDAAFSFRFGSFEPPKFESKTGVTFEEIYGENSVPSFLLDYEWHLSEKFGQLGFVVGSGIATTSGNGRFASDLNTVAIERYTLYMFLNHASIIYRMQYSDHPWLVPYFSGGFMPVGLVETRDDGIPPAYAAAMAAHGSGGIKLNLSRLDYESQFNLDSEYGINNLWLDIEFKTIQGLSKTLDLTTTMMSAGIGFDY